MGNNVLPARGGELLKIGLLGARTTARRREVLGTVLVERVLDAAVLLVLFAALTWAGVNGAPGGGGAAAAAAAALAAGAAGLAIYTAAAAPRAVRALRGGDPAGRRRVEAARPPAGDPARAHLAGDLVRRRAHVHARSPARSGSSSTCSSRRRRRARVARGRRVPAAPGYVGTFDAGMLLGLHAAGVEGGDAVGVAAARALLFFVPVTLVGLATLVLGYGGARARRSVDLTWKQAPISEQRSRS